MNTHSKFLKTAVAVSLLATASAGWAAGVGLVRLSGNAPNVQGLKYLHTHSANAVMGFTVAVAPQNRAGLVAAVKAMQDPNSPQYRHFMTHQQVVAAFSPTWVQVSAVENYLRSQGMKVESVSPDRMLIHVSAKTSTIEHAFGVNIADYNMNGTTVYAPDSDPRMPASVASSVTAVMGLDNVVQLQEHLHAGPTAATPNTIAGGAGPSGYSPQDLATHYNWPSLTDTTQASGVTIGIATAFTYRQADVNTFWDTYGLPRHTVTSVAIDGVTRRLNDETTLDVEHSGAMAPGANIIVYSGVNPQFSTFVDVFDRIYTDNTADVVSTSWGECEPDNPPASIGAEEVIVLQMLLQGQTIFAAAGDGGAQDRCTTASGASSGAGEGGLLTISATDNADYPSSAPGIGAAGGTSLDLTANTEGAWIDGGGADSQIFAEPSFETNTAGWVTNAGGTQDCFADTSDDPVNGDAFVIPAAEACAAAGDASRQSSDLTMDADFNLNLFYNGRWLGGFGGTSFVAPELAGLWAIAVHSFRAANPSIVVGTPASRLGAAPATLYPAVAACPDIVTDITAGSNGSGGVFDTATGWDHPTGWGVPNAANLITYLSTSGVTCP
ncbi:MAG TPA: S53 family peptidase [Gammaproteobacteria bacterium]|jgi:kumamolisin